MKKGLVIVILGGLMVVLQIAALLFDLFQSGALKFMPGFSADALMYNVSYLSAGLVGALLILWGFVIIKRKEE